MTADRFKDLKDQIGISYAALAVLLDRSSSSVQAYARKGCRPEIGEKMTRWAERGISRDDFSRLSGLGVPPTLTQKRAREIVEQPVRFIPWSDGTDEPSYLIGHDATAYSFRLTGGTIYDGVKFGATWSYLTLSARNGQLEMKRPGYASGITRARAVALAWLGEPPSDGYEAQRIHDDKPLSADNVRWGSFHERVEEQFGGDQTRDDFETRVRLSNAVSLKVREQYKEEVRAYGVTYVVEKIIRSDLGMDRPLTPREKQTGHTSGTRAAKIRLTAYHHPDLSRKAIGEKVGASPEMVGRVLSEAGISLKKLRRRKMIDDAVSESQTEQRDYALKADAESGLFTARELGDRYDVTTHYVYKILSRLGVSLAEAKAKRENDVRRRQQKDDD